MKRRVQTRWRIAPLQLMQRRVIALQHLLNARISRRAGDEADARNGLARKRHLLQHRRPSSGDAGTAAAAAPTAVLTDLSGHVAN